MAKGLDTIFLKFSEDKLKQLADRIVNCLGRLTADEVWARGTENENAVGNLVLHLCGNVRQWIISGVGAQPDVRQRDAEFAARGGAAPEELAAKLRGTVSEAVEVLRRVTAERLAETVVIQGYTLTVMAAIYSVVEHFGQHTGQILFATKQFRGEDLGFYKHLSRAAHSEKTP